LVNGGNLAGIGGIKRNIMYNREKYYFNCWRCGTLVPKMNKEPLNRIFCRDCAEEHYKEITEAKERYINLRTKLMFENALMILEKQNVKMYKYIDAAETIKEVIEKGLKQFDSAHEIVAVMELLRNKIRVKIHPTVGKYKIDFTLPELFVVLEIDGYMHNFKKLEDTNRDIEIRKELGAEWEVVRIPTKYIESNVKALVKAIKEIRHYKQNIRANNHGIVPKWFSERDAKRWEDIEKGLY